jgi:hypothetical protein
MAFSKIRARHYILKYPLNEHQKRSARKPLYAANDYLTILTILAYSPTLKTPNNVPQDDRFGSSKTSNITEKAPTYFSNCTYGPVCFRFF